MLNPLQSIRRAERQKKGFTLMEIIIATTIFTVVGVMGVTIFVNVMRVQSRITLENAIYEDGRFMMERIAREIRQNTVDYEEYFREADNLVPKLHGQEFGCYAQQFMELGSDTDYGTKCNASFGSVPVKDSPGCVINKTTQDINSGQNPVSAPGVRADDANARCSAERGDNPTDCRVGAAGYDNFFKADQLFLINARGTEKTYLGLKQVNNTPVENSVAMLMLEGVDTDSDGIREQWVDLGVNYYTDFCMEGFVCPNSINNLDANLDGTDGEPLYNGFVPLTPLRTNITSLTFYISPLEDPRKAFTESDPAHSIQQQPHITVVMTLQPAASQISSFAGPLPSITIQTTVSSRVYNEVDSYLGENACL